MTCTDSCTAKVGEEFTAVTNQTISFQPGETEKTIKLNCVF